MLTGADTRTRSGVMTWTVAPWGVLTHPSQRYVGGVVDGGGGENEGGEVCIRGGRHVKLDTPQWPNLDEAHQKGRR